MVEIIVDNNADVDVLLREITRLQDALRVTHPGRRVLLWGDVCGDATVQQLFPERLPSVMNAAKNQRAIHFACERLLVGVHDEVEIDILAPHLRILPESAIHSRSQQEERKAVFKEAKLRVLAEHKEKMLRLAMQGFELPRGGAPSNTVTDGAAGETNAEKDEPPPPPPPPPPPADDDDDDDDDSVSESDSDDDDDDDDDDDEEEEEDVPPPPPPPPPPAADDDDDDDGDDLPPPPPPPPE